MSDKYTRASLNFEFFERINTDLTPFEVILYFFKTSTNMLVEIPDEGKCYITHKNDIKKYITLTDVETSWEKLIDGTYIKIKGQEIKHILPIRNEFEFVHLTLEFKMYNIDLDMVRTIKEKNFKIRKKYAENRKSMGRVIVSAFLPMWPLWAKTKRSVTDINKRYTVSRMYMKIGSTFYRFPYGNVNSSDGVCLGGNLRVFKDPEEMWINFVTTRFNTDYAFNTRANKINSPIYTRRSISSGVREQNLAGIEINVPSFNLEEISLRLAAKEFNNISIIDVLYYLSNVSDFDEFDPLDIFYKLPNEPWEEKNDD